MSQQLQQPQYGAQSTMSQATAGMSSRYDQAVPIEVQSAVQDLDHLANVAEWTERAVCQRGNHQAVRICADIESLAHTAKGFILRQSPGSQQVSQVVQQQIQTSISELQQTAAVPEVQETVQQAQKTLNSLQQAISRLPAGGSAQGVYGGTQQFGSQVDPQQLGSQQFGPQQLTPQATPQQQFGSQQLTPQQGYGPQQFGPQQMR